MQKTKERITISIDKNLLNYLDKVVASKKYATKSHALEVFLKERIDEEFFLKVKND